LIQQQKIYTNDMEKFLFIIREDLKKTREQTEEERYEDIRVMDEWVKALAESGNYLFGGI